MPAWKWSKPSTPLIGAGVGLYSVLGYDSNRDAPDSLRGATALNHMRATGFVTDPSVDAEVVRRASLEALWRVPVG